MNKMQLTLLAGSVLLLLGLFFGVNTKPSNHKIVEQKRLLTAESTDISSLLIEAKPLLTKKQSAFILSLEQQVSDAQADTTRIAAYKALASKWYEYNRADISGVYAEEVATLEKTEMAWSIAGTTFLLGARQAKEEKNKRFCADKAVRAFENAISINPENIKNKVNLATCYAENPPKENPMKGVMMLLDLNKSNPESVPVLVSLGRFGIQTGQFEKAKERLTKAIQLDASHQKAHCLLAEALKGLGQTAAAAAAQEKCKLLQ